MDETPTPQTDYTQTLTSCCEEMKDYARENPVRVILAGVGVGLLLAAALRPRKPARSEHRAVRILEDIQDRLKEIAEPAYRRAVDKSAAAVKEGVEHLEDLDLPGSLCTLKKRVLDLFH